MKTHPKIMLSGLFLLALLLSGCVTGSQVLTGASRPPVAPSAVKVYDVVPAGAEVIGFVTANSTASFSWDKAKVQCIEKLREKAGSVGANGIVITNIDDSVWEGQKMQGKAIYVAETK